MTSERWPERPAARYKGRMAVEWSAVLFDHDEETCAAGALAMGQLG
jgi:hypothetical protein